MDGVRTEEVDGCRQGPDVVGPQACTLRGEEVCSLAEHLGEEVYCLAGNLEEEVCCLGADVVGDRTEEGEALNAVQTEEKENVGSEGTDCDSA